jgi:hypothetical protein
MTRDEADGVEEIESAMFAAPPADAATETVDCPDCSVAETATGWTLRRCNRHRIDVRFVSVAEATPAPAPTAKEREP